MYKLRQLTSVAILMALASTCLIVGEAQRRTRKRPARSVLTGTYRLDPKRSDDPREAADRATRNLNDADRQAVADSLASRLESPDTLAIDKRGSTVRIASSRAPRFTFIADGQERLEHTDHGNTVRARAK